MAPLLLPRAKVDRSLLDALSAYQAKIRRERPGDRVTMSDVLRSLIWRALSAEGFAAPADERRAA